ncbi:hypothetical protein At1D1460_29320 [Agrobacterium tumefaciens]|nr:hypothetical protein At1D1460_29320 [Agrobacterium tumefaciens]
MHWENMADLMVVFAVWAYVGGFFMADGPIGAGLTVVDAAFSERLRRSCILCLMGSRQ